MSGAARLFVTVVGDRPIQPGEVLAVVIDAGNYRMYARPIGHGDGPVDTRPPMDPSRSLNDQYPEKGLTP